jgi:hypothetical protein
MNEMAEQHQWTHVELAGLLEIASIASLEKLIADPGRKYRPEFARDSTIDALKYLAESEVLPDDIRALVQRILALYETASDPFLGMNLSMESEQPQFRPRVDIDAKDAEAQARQDWSNDE